MKLEIGKTYLNNHGHAVTITLSDNDFNSNYDFIGDDDCRYMENGWFFWDGPHGKLDLIEEVVVDKHAGSRHDIDEQMGSGSHHSEVWDGRIDAFTYVVAQCNRPLPLREYTSEERKGMPVHKGVMLYFPDALAAVARVSKKGNDKHNPGEPLHWSRDKSSDHADCAERHMLSPDWIDPDSGETERAHAAWRLLADLQLAEEKRLIAAGIKPFSGVVT